jgi:hypothetical protein
MKIQGELEAAALGFLSHVCHCTKELVHYVKVFLNDGFRIEATGRLDQNVTAK